MKKMVAILMAAVVFFCIVPFEANARGNEKGKCSPGFSGSFIQCWYCESWDDARWQKEIEYMKQAGVTYLVLQYTAYCASADEWTCWYPSSVPKLKGMNNGFDVIDVCLRNCQKGGIKVFVGLAAYESWFNFSALSPEYNRNCNMMAEMEKEIYRNYYSKYPESFYGWYFPPEINNIITMRLSLFRIIKGFNKVIDAADELNPDLPMMLSPYYTEYLTLPIPAAAGTMWKIFMKTVHFRDGDIFAPQDAVGAGWTRIGSLEKVWRMYSDAVEKCDSDILLWANCENMTVARKNSSFFMPPDTLEEENSPSTLDRFVFQMKTASKYCRGIITFSYNHYYCPGNVNDTYVKTYLDYLENGYRLECENPSVPDVTRNGELITWSESVDNIGIAYYVVYENGKAVKRIEKGGDLSFAASGDNVFKIIAVDGAGNKSE